MLAMAMMACLGSPAAAPTATAAAVLATELPAATPTSEAATAEPTVVGAISDEPRDAVLRALQAIPTAGPYRVESSITSGTLTTNVNGEVILPDRFHLHANSNGTEREYLIIGTTTYAKVGDQWSPIPIDLSSMIANFINSLNPDSITEVSRVGTEDVGGAPADVYTFTYTNTTLNPPLVSSDKLWIGEANGLPVKQTVDGDYNGSAYHSEQTIEYDSSITIEAPTGS
jgi:hypothetical protein